jgi:2-polyprenyl-3-methyl-5-hydroxy-6-metoxy-1,4-benzoquinol methylase
MAPDYRNELFQKYRQTHAAYLDSDTKSQIDWFLRYVNIHYMRHISGVDKNSAKMLEIGCNKGYLLAVLNLLGFKNLYGVDLSPDDVSSAKILVPSADISYADAFQFMENKHEIFDVIIMKAVLEHIRKDDTLRLLTTIKTGLKQGGCMILDVPNMDWLFASHERYMDFTHEVGFTKESLRQIMNTVFTNVTINPADNILPLGPIGNAKKRIARFILQKLFSWADPQGADNSIWERSIIGVGWK